MVGMRATARLRQPYFVTDKRSIACKIEAGGLNRRGGLDVWSNKFVKTGESEVDCLAKSCGARSYGARSAPGVRAVRVPGSMAVKRQAEAERLHEIFMDAGFEWRESGCSLCFCAGGEDLGLGKRVVSSTCPPPCCLNLPTRLQRLLMRAPFRDSQLPHSCHRRCAAAPPCRLASAIRGESVDGIRMYAGRSRRPGEGRRVGRRAQASRPR